MRLLVAMKQLSLGALFSLSTCRRSPRLQTRNSGSSAEAYRDRQTDVSVLVCVTVFMDTEHAVDSYLIC